MPRYYFDIETEQSDCDGVELRDKDAARSEAIRAAGEILRDIDGHLAGTSWTMHVRDERGTRVFEVSFSVKEPL